MSGTGSDPKRPHPNSEVGGEGNNQLTNKPGEDPSVKSKDDARRALEEEELQTGVEDSFPASDPPAITQPVHRQNEPGGTKT
jgi:hypothetical protein